MDGRETKPNKLMIILSELFLICMVAFSQTDSSPLRNPSEIANAALQSDKAYVAAEVTYEYEIPPKYWTEAIKELKPVKVYHHMGNVAVVLGIRDGVEEGIYIQPPIISSYGASPGLGTSEGFSFYDGNGPILNYRRTKPPRFEDYPVTAVFSGTPASPKIVPSSKQDMDKIRNGVEKGWGVFHGNEEKLGTNFAGHFILIKWSCGSTCLEMAIVDAKTGDVFSPPDTTNCNVSFNLLHNLTYPGKATQSPEVQFRVDSNLLIIKSNSFGFSQLPSTSYYLWQGNRWTLLRIVPLQKTESDSPGR